MFRIAKHTPDIQDRILLSLLGSKPGVRAYRETWRNFLRPCSLRVIDTPRALMALRSARVEQTRCREPAPIRQALPNPFRSLRGRRPQSLFAPREARRPAAPRVRLAAVSAVVASRWLCCSLSSSRLASSCWSRVCHALRAAPCSCGRLLRRLPLASAPQGAERCAASGATLAARLGTYASGGQILLSPDTAQRVHDRFLLRSLGVLALKNMSRPVEGWEVEGERHARTEPTPTGATEVAEGHAGPHTP